MTKCWVGDGAEKQKLRFFRVRVKDEFFHKKNSIRRNNDAKVDWEKFYSFLGEKYLENDIAS